MDALDHLGTPHSPKERSAAVKILGGQLQSESISRELTGPHSLETVDKLVEILRADDAHTRPEEKTAALHMLETLLATDDRFAAKASAHPHLVPALTALSDRHHCAANERTLANRILMDIGARHGGDVNPLQEFTTHTVGGGIVEGR